MYKFIPILVLLSGCTIANADIDHGTLDVYTFATSRKDVKITRSADGAVSWETSDSIADASAVNNLSAVVAKLVGAVIVP